MGEHCAVGATLMLFLDFGKRPVSFPGVCYMCYILNTDRI